VWGKTVFTEKGRIDVIAKFGNPIKGLENASYLIELSEINCADSKDPDYFFYIRQDGKKRESRTTFEDG
jgi:hypothetical protein